MATQTATMRLSKPATGGDQAPLWGNYLDTDMDLIDRAVNQVITINIPDAPVTLIADGTTSDQALYQAYAFTGSMSTSRAVTLPNATRFGRVVNTTTGGFSVILTTGLGASASIPPNSILFNYWVDASGNVFLLSPEQTEFLQSTQSVGIGFAPGGPAKDIASVSLTPGDWDLTGSVGFSFSSGTPTANFIQGWINQFSATAPVLYLRTSLQTNGAPILSSSLAVPSQRIIVAGTTTVFLSASMQFTTGTCTVTGQLNARRMA